MIIYEEEKFDLSTFIGGWYIPKKDCEELIKFYEKYNWKKSKAFRINKKKNYIRMVFNPKKIILRNKFITI